MGRQRLQLHRHRSDKHENGSRVETPNGHVDVHRQVHTTLRYRGLGTIVVQGVHWGMDIVVEVVDGSIP